MKKMILLLSVLTLTAGFGMAQVSIPTLDTPVTENFDGMGTAGTTFISGWTSTDGSMVVTNGSANSGGIYNVGTIDDSDRAFGSLGSGSLAPIFGAQFQNNTGNTIGSLTLSGVSEQWRSGSSSAANEVLPFEYSIDATSLTTGTWTAVSGMNLVEILTNTTSAAAVDGNSPANRTTLTGSVIGLAIPNGSSFWIRWSETDNTGSDGMYAIDDFSLTASGVPPASDGDGSATIANNASGALNGTNIFSGNVSGNFDVIVTGVETGTLTSVRVTFPGDWSEGINPSHVSLSGDGFSGANLSVSGLAITVTNASVTDVNTGTITIIGSSVNVPDVASSVLFDGNYSFTVETAVESGSLTAIDTDPSAFVILPIVNIRDVDVDGVPVDLGKTVVIEGTATVANGQWAASDLDIAIQDNTGGMTVFLSGGASNVITPGNKYIVKGLLETSSAKSRLKLAGFSDVIADGTGTLPDVTDAANIYTIADLSNEALEGTRVTIKNAALTGTWPTSATSYTNLTIDDGTGSMTLRVNTTTAGKLDKTGFNYDIVGILLQFDSSSPFTTGYQIFTRDSTDYYSANSLPVELASFQATSFADGVKLTWSTKTELNNYGFEVEKKANGNWSKLGFVSGKGTTNDPQSYSFVDSKVSGAVSYRLKQVDFDGAFEYSNEVEFVGTPAKFEVIGNYPNPFNPSTKIAFNLPSEMNVNVSVFNILGQKVAELVNGKMAAGEQSVEFNAAGFASGLYIYKVQAGANTVTRTMMLTK